MTIRFKIINYHYSQFNTLVDMTRTDDFGTITLQRVDPSYPYALRDLFKLCGNKNTIIF